MATKIEERELLEHFKGLNLNKDEIDRFSTAFKDPKFKDMFMNYVKEISDSGNKETMEKLIKQCEQKDNGKTSDPMAGKELLLPHAYFCVKTSNINTKEKVFINICYCDKIKNCNSVDDPQRHGTQWEIPYSLGGAAQEKDKTGNNCVVYDFIIGTQTHEYTNTSKAFKQFLIITAIEAIEKQKNIQLERKFTLPLIKYKGKNGSKEPRIFTIQKENLSTISQSDANIKKLEYRIDGNKASSNNSNKKENASNKENRPKKIKNEESPDLNGSCNLNAQKDIEFAHLNQGWETEIKPVYEVLYRSTIDYGQYWTDSQINDSKTVPEAILLRINLPDIFHVQDVIVDLETNRVFIRVPGKYRLKIDLKYIVNKLRSQAQWKKQTHQLVITLPIDVGDSKT